MLLGGPLFLYFNRIGLMLGRFPSLERDNLWAYLSTPEWGHPAHPRRTCWYLLPSHASVVQPPTSLWVEGACPVCTPLDQWHMGQNLRCFLGLGRERERGK